MAWYLREKVAHLRRLWRLPELVAMSERLEVRLEKLEQCSEVSLRDIQSRLNGLEHGNSTIHRTTAEIQRESRRTAIQTEDCLRDLIELVLGRAWVPRLDLRLQAAHQVADSSPDHYAPRGTANDNTRHLRFVRRCEQHYSEIRHMDVGCAGGGLVWDFTIRGHWSVGIEGSDFNLRNQRAEWRTIPDRLFTADITRPFALCDREGNHVLFNVITAWETFEHIPTNQVRTTIQNLAANLAQDGTMVCSIATFVDRDENTGIVYHQTVKEREWWVNEFASCKLKPVEGLFDVDDFVRGSGNPRAYDWDVTLNPELGFHLVLRRFDSEGEG